MPLAYVYLDMLSRQEAVVFGVFVSRIGLCLSAVTLLSRLVCDTSTTKSGGDFAC